MKRALPKASAVHLALALLLAAEPALAHERSGQTRGFITGLLHPLSGLDHVLAMIAVGLWGAQLGAPAIWLLPITFPMVMAVGGFLGLVGVSLPGVEYGIALSALLLGLMVALATKPPLSVATLMIGSFAIFHGYAHGVEIPAQESGVTYSIGFVVATGCLHASGIAIGSLQRIRAGRTVIRVLGTLVACAGVAFLWRAAVR